LVPAPDVGSLALGLVVGAVLHRAGVDAAWWLLGVALATTALGALVPILSDAGLLPTRLGTAVLGTGVAGEFWPIVVISVFLTGVTAPPPRCCCSSPSAA
jgi:Kef-type K+ transport system membrane component KefB